MGHLKSTVILLFLSQMVYAQVHHSITESRALFFACNTYDFKTAGVVDLEQPIREANNIAGVLETDFGFIVEVIENPTYDEVYEKIDEYAEAYEEGFYNENGQLLIFFSGHGISEYQNGYFLTSDSNPSGHKLHSTAIEYDGLRGTIDKMSCNHILVAIDACHSSSFSPDYKYKTRSAKPRNAGRKKPEDFDIDIANYNKYKARIYLTSDGTDNSTPDNSVFAQNFYRGLDQCRRSRAAYINVQNLFVEYMLKALPRPGQGNFGKHDFGGIFLFFNNNQSPDELLSELEYWREIRDLNTVEGYEKFLTQFPNGEFVIEAKKRLKDIIISNEWKYATYVNTIMAYESFLQNYPESEYANVAELKIKELRTIESEVSRRTEPVEVLIEVLQIPKGFFEMGGNDHIVTSEYTHRVEVGKYELGKYEVTFNQYDLFCKHTDRKKAKKGSADGGLQPVVNVSWYDAVDYCNWLSDQRGLTKVYTIDGKSVSADFSAGGYRLPTEAEWEYVASYSDKSGTKAIFANGKQMADPKELNFDGSQSFKKDYSKKGIYRKMTVEVGSLDNANAFDVCDMSGNVREWCWDWYEDNYYDLAPMQDPRGPSRGLGRVVRGGDYTQGPSGILTTKRAKLPPNIKSKTLGFRIARSL